MPGAVLIDAKLDSSHSLGGQPRSPPSPQELPPPPSVSPLRHYIPVLTRSVAPSLNEGDLLCRRPAGLCLNVNALPDLYAEDGSLLVDAEPFTQRSPLSAAQLANIGVSPNSISALSALGRFLPSNLDKDGAESLQYDAYSGDEFRMYEFKVRKCMRGRSHDWTECPFAHPGEKARRRDPRVYDYVGVLCADYKKGSCKKGDACGLAHGVFECWLHPTRYRTQPCKDGRGCRRRICFFAHTADQLRDGLPASSSPLSTSPSPSPTSVEMLSEKLDLPNSLPSTASRKSANNPEFLMAPSSLSGADAVIARSSSPRPARFELSPSANPLSSPSHERHTGLSFGSGLSTFRLPAAVPVEAGQPLQSIRNQVVKTPHNHWPKDVQQSLYSAGTDLNLMASSPLASSGAYQKSQKMEDLVRLMRLVDLAQDQEPVWKQKLPPMLPQKVPFHAQCAWNVHVAPTEKCRHSDDVIFGQNFFDDEEEPQLERVESGKGLRAQIFESLLSSTGSPCT